MRLHNVRDVRVFGSKQPFPSRRRRRHQLSSHPLLPSSQRCELDVPCELRRRHFTNCCLILAILEIRTPLYWTTLHRCCHFLQSSLLLHSSSHLLPALPHSSLLLQTDRQPASQPTKNTFTHPLSRSASIKMVTD